MVVPGMSHWDESPGQTQDTLKRSYLLAGLVALGFPPDKVEEVVGEREV